MGTRIAIINQGALQQIGPPQEVYNRPANVFVAQFIGSPPMNIVAGEVTRQGETLAVTARGASVTLPPTLAEAVARRSTDHVIVGVRPEHVSIDDGPVGARVTSVESLGHERHVICSLAGGQRLVVRLPSEDPVPAPGASVQLTAATEHLHLFDAATTLRID